MRQVHPGLDGAPPAAALRRAVFYIPGYDPRGPAYYHRLYREQAAIQAALTGATITVGSRRKDGPLVEGWAVTWDHDGQLAHTQYLILRWDDQVRAAWRWSEPHLLVQVWRGVIVFARRGLLALTARRWRAPFFASLFPMAASSLYLLALAGAALGLWLLARAILALGGVPSWLALLAPLLVASQAVRGWRWLDPRLGVGWLSRSIAYMIDTAADPSVANARCDAFARIVTEAAGAAAFDEILIVGHSQGASHAVRTAARTQRAFETGAGPARTSLGLLTLGQPLALYTRLGGDASFRSDLARIANSDRLVWLDYTQPGDPVSSSDIDPLEGLGLTGARWPRRASPRFHQLVSPARFRRMQRRLLDYHFQYLMAGERIGAYDFFRLTAGPERLSQELAR